LHAEAPAGGQITPLTETFLFCADRAEHVSAVIVPALLAGSWVVGDRFSAATFAYQVWAGGVDPAAFSALDETARAGLRAVPGPETSHGRPDHTLLLDLDPAAGLARKSADAADKIEQRSAAYHRRVREGFLRYAEQGGGPIAVLSAVPAPQEIFAQILRALGLEA
jgi:dTMP kinase